MSALDWIVLVGTLVLIAVYGTWRTRKEHSREDYLRAGNSSRWWAVGFGVVATQLSAVTFLSTPGQGYLDGMRFIQFYFGLPLAMVVICVVFIPMYYKWKVYTAYEFIGKRFDQDRPSADHSIHDILLFRERARRELLPPFLGRRVVELHAGGNGRDERRNEP